MTRLTTRMRVDALIRRAQVEGGFAAVLRHGDDTAGNLVLILARRDRSQAALQRIMGPGGYAWTTAAEQPAGESGVIDEWLRKQSSYDPDLWAIELDVADPERFIAESTGDD